MPNDGVADIDRRSFLKAASAAGIISVAGCSGNGSSGGGDGGGGDGDETADSSGSDDSSSDSGSGDDWVPEQNLRVIVPWGAGGGTDTMTRGITKPAETILQEDRGVDVSINVENVTGANGLNGAREVLNQPADGYTVFANTNVVVPNIVAGRANFSMDDWAGLCRVQHDTSWLYGTGREDSDAYFETAEELVNYAKDNTVQMGVTGGVASAIFIYQVATAAGIWDKTELVSYDDAGKMTNDVVSGEIHAGFGEIQEIKEQLDSGDLNALVVGTEERLDEFPDVPTTVELGWEDATWGVTRGFNVKAGTPDAAIKYWMDLFKEAYESDQYQQLAEETMVDLRQGWQPAEEWMNHLRSERELFAEVRDALQEK